MTVSVPGRVSSSSIDCTRIFQKNKNRDVAYMVYVESSRGLRRDLNPPQAVSVEGPQPPILTRLYYEGQQGRCSSLYIIVR